MGILVLFQILAGRLSAFQVPHNMNTGSLKWKEWSRILKIPLLRSQGHIIITAQMQWKDYEQDPLGMMKSAFLEYSSESMVKERKVEEVGGNLGKHNKLSCSGPGERMKGKRWLKRYLGSVGEEG